MRHRRESSRRSSCSAPRVVAGAASNGTASKLDLASWRDRKGPRRSETWTRRNRRLVLANRALGSQTKKCREAGAGTATGAANDADRSHGASGEGDDDAATAVQQGQPEPRAMVPDDGALGVGSGDCRRARECRARRQPPRRSDARRRRGRSSASRRGVHQRTRPRVHPERRPARAGVRANPLRLDPRERRGKGIPDRRRRREGPTQIPRSGD